jgi:Tol biopolymer transport system component
MLAIVAVGSAISLGAAGMDESVLSELVRLEKETGLAIAFYENELGVISFKKRASYDMGKLVPMGSSGGTVSPDGAEVAVDSSNWGAGYRNHILSLDVVGADGSRLREYREVRGGVACWSHDKSKLAMIVRLRPEAKLQILDLTTTNMQTFGPQTAEQYLHLTSQCWAPNGKELVFEANGNVQVYEIETDHSRILAAGTEPTWSPDGTWIAYRDEQHSDYYVIHPSGDGRKRLFHKGRAVSPLYWSPDERFVAYVHQDFFALDVEFYHLMVRRLEDNSETWVADGVACCIGYQWVRSPALLKRAEAADKAKRMKKPS